MGITRVTITIYFWVVMNQLTSSPVPGRRPKWGSLNVQDDDCNTTSCENYLLGHSREQGNLLPI